MSLRNQHAVKLTERQMRRMQDASWALTGLDAIKQEIQRDRPDWWSDFHSGAIENAVTVATEVLAMEIEKADVRSRDGGA